ncbi:hypothetical protein AAULR_19341, partial [Lacticaseibacillus rhamnosus MTCC 5462]
GYTTPISGTFIVKEDGSYAVVSDAKYIDASVTELDRHLISQGMQVKVANIDGSKKYDCVVKKLTFYRQVKKASPSIDFRYPFKELMLAYT